MVRLSSLCSALALGPAAVAAAGVIGTGRAPLVSMRENEGQIFSTVSVAANGRGEIGFFIGEATGTHYRAFSLSSHSLAQLRMLVADANAAHVRGSAGSSTLPFVNDIQYIVTTRKRSFVTTAAQLTPRVEPLVDYLSGLINRYSTAASSSRRTAPTPSG